MASGYPDWKSYRHVNILEQGLSEVINRPKYGAAKSIDGVADETATGNHTLVEITGKGVIYGGYAFVSGNFASKGDNVHPIFETAVFGSLTFESLAKYNITIPGAHYIYIRQYDIVNKEYAVCLLGNMTFETSFSLVYGKSAAGASVAIAQVIYALV